jgi:hypothetical protein
MSIYSPEIHCFETNLELVLELEPESESTWGLWARWLELSVGQADNVLEVFFSSGIRSYDLSSSDSDQGLQIDTTLLCCAANAARRE